LSVFFFLQIILFLTYNFFRTKFRACTHSLTN
jgi:hypothetical protein